VYKFVLIKTKVSNNLLQTVILSLSPPSKKKLKAKMEVCNSKMLEGTKEWARGTMGGGVMEV